MKASSLPAVPQLARRGSFPVDAIIFCMLLFVKALGLPISIIGSWFGI
jgi:hypothetical protein